MPTPLATVRLDVWIAALGTGIVPLAAFVAWADHRIAADSCQPRWVLDLSLAPGVDAARRIMYEEWHRLCEFTDYAGPRPYEPGNLHVGFLYLAFRAGRLTTCDLLRRAALYAEDVAQIDFDGGTAFRLLREMEGDEPPSIDGRPLRERLDVLFGPVALLAAASLGDLPDCHADTPPPLRSGDAGG